MYRTNANVVKRNPVSFGHIYDYYDPEEIKEARDNYGVFREPGENDFDYWKRARDAHEAWETVQKQHETKKHWWE